MLTLSLFIVYLLSLIPFAWRARRSGAKNPHDFYLAGRSLGTGVLVCTLFATQYSGNTFMAFPGKAYRMGYAYIMSVTFMMAIVAFYLTYAPSLTTIARKQRFITPCDWIHLRYNNIWLTMSSALLMTWALLNFLLAQLMAMGHAVEGLTGGAVAYQTGVLFLAIVIVTYESVGGMRAVAWTDTLQGIIMIAAVFVLGIYLISDQNKITMLPEKISQISPEKIQAPTFEICATWLSSIIIVGLGGAMYPQGIQRILAARSTKILKKSLAILVFMPLITVVFAYLMGITAIVQFQELSDLKSDQVMTLLLADIAQRNMILYIAVSVLLLGALAAIMSTADSIILSLSSIIVQDIYGRSFGRGTKEEHLLRLGKYVSWILTCGTVAVALSPNMTLWRLLEIKFELLIQVAPAFILGFHIKNLDSRVALFGLILGCTIAIIGFFQGGKWYGFHPGTVGCIVNGSVLLLFGRRNG